MARVPNHFELFGLPVAFDMDEALLARRYRELQASVHPDRFAGASDRERRLSVQHAAQVNEAFRTLRDPLQRARYLLELGGRAVGLEDNTAMDPAFLMEQMELREALDAVRADPDRAVPGMEAVLADIEGRADALRRELAARFDAGDAEALDRACDAVRKLQFMERLRQQALELEEELLEL